jgi:hypothetical protein
VTPRDQGGSKRIKGYVDFYNLLDVENSTSAATAASG